MEDEAGIDNKIVAVPISEVDPRFDATKTYEDLAEHVRKEMQQFLMDYKKLENQKDVKFGGWKGKEDAMKIITEAINRYKEGQ